MPARGSTPNSQGIYGFAKFQDVLKTHETIINCLGENDTQLDTRKTILKDMGNVIAQMIAAGFSYRGNVKYKKTISPNLKILKFHLISYKYYKYV